MIIDNFNVIRVAIFESEANMPLIIDPEAPLTLSVSFEGFKAV